MASCQRKGVGTILISERFARICMEYNASMERFVHRKKLEHYLTLLTQTKDEAQRQQLLKLLAQEETTAQQPPEREVNKFPDHLIGGRGKTYARMIGI